MPTLYCIKFGLIYAGLIMVAIIALFALFGSLTSLWTKRPEEKTAQQNG